MSVLRKLLCLSLASLFLAACGKQDGDDVARAETHAGHDQASHDHGDQDGNAHAEAEAGGSAGRVPPAASGHVHGDDPHSHAEHFVVKVNGKELKHDELNRMVQQMLSGQMTQIPEQMREQFLQQMVPRFQQQAIDRFIASEVLEGEADRQKLIVADAQVNERLDAIRKQLPPSVKWEEALKQMGTSEELMRAEVSKEMKIGAVIDKHLATMPKATAEEIKAIYDNDPSRYATESSVSARHVLITCQADADEATKAAKLAEVSELRKKIVEGADFAEIAKAHSDCPSKDRGGDLGSFGMGQMVPEFEKAVLSQELNKVGDVVETQFGYHLIEVTQREESRQKSFEEVKKQVADELARKSKDEGVSTYIAALRDKAEVSFGEGHGSVTAPPTANP